MTDSLLSRRDLLAVGGSLAALEATGLVYRAKDLYSFFGVPALLFDRVKIGGQWCRATGQPATAMPRW